ncbi:ROK family protein [Lacticaseibacillus mingshuiensis]|uniref:ROK family protein n=1 Tax=Lacticaseibacillus mingshuiensis TaxID=2799574 RepID=A0ABW4CH27_9LACO|nr:ROK family protein [Lacticaseibacillus mingshuiensis]
MALAVIDVGGTTIKLAVWDNNELKAAHAIATPKTLTGFYEDLTAEVKKFQQAYAITGVAMSTPGAVNQDTGVIEGASALPYIHNFPIQPELAAHFGLPVTFENDANCAALAEVASGAGAGKKRVIVLVLGTGVGGAIIADGKIEHGAHLLGGEFGFMVQGDNTVSGLGTAVNAANRYNAATGENKSGKEVFDLADAGDPQAIKEVETMYHALAVTIFNLQYSYDPELFLLGGGVSRNPRLLPGVEAALDAIMKQVEIATVRPEVAICKYKDEANLIGAVANFEQHLD